MVRRLGQLESVVMQRLWTYGRPVAVREVLEDMQRDRVIAYTTVMTVMDNLHRKGFLTREMVGRAYQYLPTQTREQHHAAVMDEVLTDSSDRAATLLHFVDQMSRDEVTKLRAALAERATQSRGKGRRR